MFTKVKVSAYLNYSKFLGNVYNVKFSGIFDNFFRKDIQKYAWRQKVQG